MTAADFLLIGGLLLPGSLILLNALGKMFRSRPVPRMASAFLRLHGKATRALIDKRVLRFPGIHLVTSIRGWVAGELILVAAIVLSLGLHASFAEFLLRFLAGILLGGAAFFLSFRDAARNELDAVRSALPVASFLLSLMLEAGMGSFAAVQEVVRALPQGPLSRELEEIDRSRLLGISRTEAFERSRDRVPLDDYRSFLNLVQQGERLGIALSQGLRELSSRMMESQGHRAETLAQKAAVKLLFPLVLFIFPSVFLIIFSPVILNLWNLLGG
jgi:tight adherence protein C